MDNRAYIFTSLGTCGVILHMYVFTTLIGQLVAPYGLTEQDFVVQMGLFIFGFGVLGGIVFSIVLTWYPEKMMKAAYLTCITSILTLAFFFFADTRANKAEISISLAIHGFFLLPILFIAYELAVK